MLELKVASRGQGILGDFFGAKRKSQCLSSDSDASGLCKISKTDMTATNSVDICKTDETNTSTKKGHIKTCFGIIRINSTDYNKVIGLYTQYDSISSKAKYKFGLYGERHQLFANNCTGIGCIERDQNNGGV